MEPGDFVFIGTDGITNSANAAGEEYGKSRLLDALARASPPAGKLGEAVLESIAAFVGNTHMQDDATMVCFGRNKSQLAELPTGENKRGSVLCR